MVDATKWAVDDVRKRDKKLLLAIFVLPPSADSSGFTRAQNVFRGLGAHVATTEQQFGRWAEREARSIPKKAALG
jgi:hypothetical protein